MRECETTSAAIPVLHVGLYVDYRQVVIGKTTLKENDIHVTDMNNRRYLDASGSAKLLSVVWMGLYLAKLDQPISGAPDDVSNFLHTLQSAGKAVLEFHAVAIYGGFEIVQ